MGQKTFPQTTLNSAVSLAGRGLFTGCWTQLTLRPADLDTGVVFKIKDVIVPALHTNLLSASGRNTVLGDGSKEGTIYCVEHLLSAIFGCGVTNLVIEMDAPEVPILDGSSKEFVEAIKAAGVVEQKAEIEPYELDSPCYWSSGNVHVIALPSSELRYSYTLSYEDHPLLHSQFFSFPYTKKGVKFYENEIAPARTFCLIEEAKALIAAKVVKGGGLECAVVIDGEKVINPEGLRYKDEMVRHKILDMVGDMSLIGRPVLAHFIGIRSGHEANAAIVQMIMAKIQVAAENREKGVCV